MPIVWFMDPANQMTIEYTYSLYILARIDLFK